MLLPPAFIIFSGTVILHPTRTLAGNILAFLLHLPFSLPTHSLSPFCQFVTLKYVLCLFLAHALPLPQS